MTKKDDENKKSWAAILGKLAAGFMAAMAAGGAGSMALGDTPTFDTKVYEERISALEHSCQSYDVRIATTETKLDGVEVNMIDIKKDLADIRSTSTQILLTLQRNK